jgi:hypothetical protein
MNYRGHRAFLPRVVFLLAGALASQFIVCLSVGKGSENNDSREPRELIVECFVLEKDSACERAKARLVQLMQELERQRDGRKLKLEVWDVSKSEDKRRRLWRIVNARGVKKAEIPTVFVLGNAIVGCGHANSSETPEFDKAFREALTVKLYADKECLKCQPALTKMRVLKQDRPNLDVEVCELSDPTIFRDFGQLLRQHQLDYAIPMLCFGGKLIPAADADVGFDELHKLLKRDE